jgi:hypothetical protein
MGFFLNGYPRVVEAQSAPVIVYVDEGWKIEHLTSVESEIKRAVAATAWNGQQALYYIAFAWKDGETPMVDLWRFIDNPIDSISGPLAEVVILRDGKETRDLGVASGQTLLVLGLEEQHRRAVSDTKRAPSDS